MYCGKIYNDFTLFTIPNWSEPAGLFNQFLTEHTEWTVDVRTVPGGTFIIRASQRERYISSSKIWIAAKDKKKKMKKKKQRKRGLLQEKAKHIWWWMISNGMQNGLCFEANQNSREQRFTACCLLMFSDNGTGFWHRASLVTVFSRNEQLKCCSVHVIVCVCEDQSLVCTTYIYIHERYSKHAPADLVQ